MVANVRKSEDNDEIDADLSNRLTNSLEMLSLHRLIGKSLGKDISDYSFNPNK